MSSVAPNNNEPNQQNGDNGPNSGTGNDSTSPVPRKRRRSDGGESSEDNNNENDDGEVVNDQNEILNANTVLPSNEQVNDTHDQDENSETSADVRAYPNDIETRRITELEPDFDLNNAFDDETPSNTEPVTVPSPGIDSEVENNIHISNGSTVEPVNLATQETEPNVISNGETTSRENISDTSNNQNRNTSEDIIISSVHNVTPTLIDDEATEQQVVEISDEELEKEIESKAASKYKAARDYQCPICFDPPDTALITRCGHVFCCDCLFHMVNSSRTNRSSGHCALCRSNVKFNDVKLVIMRKKRVKKS
ncbi:similar to Saccharomyces cerevisiae YER116C SLX8 Subunit of the Slx5-Slx8 SUMO-targeted ubiquitin ligase (STUbL) complex [Maudiozyma saulgeensis]|uniref:Similar to Saccharomyces cerevisiae YER116C SLX8 Subunit of the Slx5-Slx8 SUMO-targeted ubiquitin ligase (STUbL) complex n=1 Tax=Maudiozyma saulgeensis TaxID=1789683 RepID=A0A1X7QZ04_9SACH|nr:similar to Saccharomyces cerevisiae YER116C SLX8 Subunit of the Slx5-Slx8 SUMO-targeted ubiquitin ligase (STUbL) complex [Kazachstania saulgeensis]